MDVRLNRIKNRRLNLDIYRKPTHSGRYPQYSSHQSENVKRSVARGLFDRVQYVTEVSDKRKEEKRIKDELKKERLSRENDCTSQQVDEEEIADT